MSKQINHLYEFGEFRLETAERLLLREGRPISLTAKGIRSVRLVPSNRSANCNASAYCPHLLEAKFAGKTGQSKSRVPNAKLSCRASGKVEVCALLVGG